MLLGWIVSLPAEAKIEDFMPLAMRVSAAYHMQSKRSRKRCRGCNAQPCAVHIGKKFANSKPSACMDLKVYHITFR